MRVPVSDADALFTLDHQCQRMENKLVQTNSLLGKALIPLIRFMDKYANSQIPTMIETFMGINDSLCMLLLVFNYLNLIRRDHITDEFKAKSLQKTVKDKNMTGDKLLETIIVDIVKQFKENQKHINPKGLKVRRNYKSYCKGSKGPRYNSNRGNLHGKAGRRCGNYSTK